MLTAMRRALQLAMPTAKDDPRELHVVILDNDAITRMNEDFLGHEGPTDVISFDLRDEQAFDESAETSVAGEIYVGLGVAREAARKYTTTLGYEVMLYIAHGMLHLAGEDDLEPEPKARMRAAETRVMDVLQREFNLTELFACE